MNPCVGAVRRAVAALNDGDVDGYVNAFAATCTRIIPGTTEPLSIEEVVAGMQVFASALDDFRLEEVRLFGEGRQVCAHWVVTGTHTGDQLGVPATGRRAAFESAEIYQFQHEDGGLIDASWSFADTASWFAQLEVDR
jgi:steroid delta-isomerase-like uncharacterized protein